MRTNDVRAFVTSLRACTIGKDLSVGARVHDGILRLGLLEECSDALVTMYAKCGAVAEAKELFHTYPSGDIFTWTALISACAQKGQGQEALKYFEQMQHVGLSPDAVTYCCILRACGSIRAVDKGEKIHDKINEQGLLDKNVILGNALIDMYVKCGALAKARRALQELPVRNVITWTALITGYADYGEGEQALECFQSMQCEHLLPDVVTYSSILKACGSIRASDKGKKIHGEIVKHGLLGNNIVLSTALMDMYVKCGALAKARRVLEELPIRNVISWNPLIMAYIEHGEGEQALDCFDQMLRDGLCPDAVTYSSILKACGSIRAADKGERLHGKVAKLGFLGTDIVLGTALVDMYAKGGALGKAQQVLAELPMRNATSWTALITGYIEHNEAYKALGCLEQMQCEGLSPDMVTFVCILKACGSLGAVDIGEKLHNEIAKQGWMLNDIVLGTALVDMYAKCGALAKARRVLERLPVRSTISWNALITGYVQQCDSAQALNCFEQMQREGLPPNASTFSCVLSACSRLCLLEHAHIYFLRMGTNYGMNPDVEHYTCLVDLFGRVGYLDRALEVLRNIPSATNVVWSALLGACQKSGVTQVGRWAFEHAVHVCKTDVADHVCFDSIYTGSEALML